MEDKTNFIEPLIERFENYGETTYKLIKLKVLEKMAGIVSTFVANSVIFFILSMSILIINIGIALWLGELFGKLYYGFFCVAGFYGIIGGVLYFFMNNRIKDRIGNSFISHILK